MYTKTVLQVNQIRTKSIQGDENMEGQVMGYFFSIGFGVSAGIATVSIPAMLLYNKLKNRTPKGRKEHV